MSEYERQAIDFLRKTDCELVIEYINDVQGFPFDDKDKLMHRHYECTLTRRGRHLRKERSYTFSFYGSYAAWKDGKDPNEYDVLACLEPYCPDTIDEFVDSFGFEFKSWDDVRRIEEMYKRLKEHSKHLKRMFSKQELEVLAEIT